MSPGLSHAPKRFAPNNPAVTFAKVTPSPPLIVFFIFKARMKEHIGLGRSWCSRLDRDRERGGRGKFNSPSRVADACLPSPCQVAFPRPADSRHADPLRQPVARTQSNILCRASSRTAVAVWIPWTRSPVAGLLPHFFGGLVLHVAVVTGRWAKRR